MPGCMRADLQSRPLAGGGCLWLRCPSFPARSSEPGARLPFSRRLLRASASAHSREGLWHGASGVVGWFVGPGRPSGAPLRPRTSVCCAVVSAPGVVLGPRPGCLLCRGSSSELGGVTPRWGGDTVAVFHGWGARRCAHSRPGTWVARRRPRSIRRSCPSARRGDVGDEGSLSGSALGRGRLILAEASDLPSAVVRVEGSCDGEYGSLYGIPSQGTL